MNVSGRMLGDVWRRSVDEALSIKAQLLHPSWLPCLDFHDVPKWFPADFLGFRACRGPDVDRRVAKLWERGAIHKNNRAIPVGCGFIHRDGFHYFGIVL